MVTMGPLATIQPAGGDTATVPRRIDFGVASAFPREHLGAVIWSCAIAPVKALCLRRAAGLACATPVRFLRPSPCSSKRF